jgi:hypothetical protein
MSSPSSKLLKVLLSECFQQEANVDFQPGDQIVAANKIDATNKINDSIIPTIFDLDDIHTIQTPVKTIKNIVTNPLIS